MAMLSEFIKNISYIPKTKTFVYFTIITHARLYLFLYPCVLPLHFWHLVYEKSAVEIQITMVVLQFHCTVYIYSAQGLVRSTQLAPGCQACK
jgi:hypothetical protein